MSKITMRLVGAAVLATGITLSAAHGNEFAPKLQETYSSQIQPWLTDPVVVEAIKAQNSKNASVGDGDIDAMDKKWRSEAKSGSGPMIDEIMGNKLSNFLKQKAAESDGLFTEIFVMDFKGLNVGQSAVTSDYMQGDEAKWQKTYQAGPDAVFIDEVEFDDSTQSFQTQMSATVVDPATGQAIGAITIGVNVEKL